MSRNITVSLLVFLVASVFLIQLASASMIPAFPSNPMAVSLNSPGSGAWANSTPVNFNFTAITNATGTLNCTLYIDGAPSGTQSVANNTPSIIAAAVTAGSHAWNVSCIDTASQSAFSTTRSFTVDLAAPSVTLSSPPDMNLSNSSSMHFNFTATDDASTTMNCSVWVDGSIRAYNDAVPNNTIFSFGVTVSEGPHTWYVQCKDQANNTGSSANRSFTLDLTSPAINVSSPLNGEMQNTTGVVFSYTPTDNMANTTSCSLYVDSLLQGAFTVGNDTQRTDTYYFSSGYHTWNVSCVDQAGNAGTSATRSFIINLPASAVLNSPADGTWITSPNPVNVTFNFTVFDDNVGVGAPGGVQSGDVSISTAGTAYCTDYLDGSSIYSAWFINNTSASFNHTVSLGVHTWYVQCDDNPPVSPDNPLMGESIQSISNSPTYTLTVSATGPSVSSSSGEGLKAFNITASASCPGDKADIYASTASGDLLGGVNVRAVLSDPYTGLVAQGTTDSSGHVVFILNSSGTYDFSATEGGYRNTQASLQFTACGQPAQQNVTPPPPPPQPPVIQTHIACVNEACTPVDGAGNNTCASDKDCVTVSPPPPPPNQSANQSMLAANQSISDAQSAISDAQAGGKDVSAATDKLAEAQAAFASGDYAQATALAEEAKQLALGAAAPLPPPQPAAASSVQAPVTTPEGGPSLLLLLLILVILIIILGAAAYMLFGRKKKAYK